EREPFGRIKRDARARLRGDRVERLPEGEALAVQGKSRLRAARQVGDGDARLAGQFLECLLQGNAVALQAEGARLRLRRGFLGMGGGQAEQQGEQGRREGSKAGHRGSSRREHDTAWILAGRAWYRK